MTGRSKIVAVIVLAAVIAAQVWYTYTRGSKVTGNVVPAPGVTNPGVPLQADNITAIAIGPLDGDPFVTLSRGRDGWIIDNLFNAPASRDKVDRLIKSLLSPRTNLPSMGTSPTEYGIMAESPHIHLFQEQDGTDPVRTIAVGSSLPGRFDAVYVQIDGTGPVEIVESDLRGELGIFGDAMGAASNPMVWLDTEVASFPVDRVHSLNVNYPDHQILVFHDQNGEWQTKGLLATIGWNRDGIPSWLKKVAGLAVTSVKETDAGASDDVQPTHSIEVVLDDGSSRMLFFHPDHGDDGMWLSLDSHPGLEFLIPGWRFTHAMSIFETLLPETPPRFSYDDIVFLDIRRNGESVKIARRDGVWQAFAAMYPIVQDRIEALARTLAQWRPVDIADPSDVVSRPGYGGPLVEVTLNTGQVYQYRLGGVHPVFPWRYVLIDGRQLVSAREDDALFIFPRLAEILELGSVFNDVDFDALESLELSMAGGAGPAFTAVKRGDHWIALTPDGEESLDDLAIGTILHSPLTWRITDFYRLDPDLEERAGMMRLRLSGEDGTVRSITILPPKGLGVPVVTEGNRSYLIDRSLFAPWIAAVRDIATRLEEAAIREEEQELETGLTGDLGGDSGREDLESLEIPADDAIGAAFPVSSEAGEMGPPPPAESETSVSTPLLEDGDIDETGERPAELPADDLVGEIQQPDAASEEPVDTSYPSAENDRNVTTDMTGYEDAAPFTSLELDQLPVEEGKLVETARGLSLVDTPDMSFIRPGEVPDDTATPADATDETDVETVLEMIEEALSSMRQEAQEAVSGQVD